MTWLQILGLVVAVIVIATVFFIKPKGGRPAANTNLMTAARITLVVVAVIIAAAILF